MTNLADAFAGLSQGLGQMAGMQMQKEMQEVMAERAVNLAYLRNALSTHREIALTGARGQVLEQVSSHRVAAEHAARDEEIDRQSAGSARNAAAAQHRQLINTEAAQNNAFTNQAELAARGQGGRSARVQAARDAVVQANQARAQKAAIREWLGKYSAVAHGSVDPRGVLTTDPMTAAQLAQLAAHDPVLRSQLQAYKDADAREQAATRAMGKFPSPYDTPSTPGAVAPVNDAPASPPTTSLIPIPSEGAPGIADRPYSDSGAGDEIGLGGLPGGSAAPALVTTDY